MALGVFRCGPHNFDTDAEKKLPEQEEQWYQHLRDEEHKTRYSKACENCGKQGTGEITAKVPQPTPDHKNPRSPIVFCDNDNKCKNEYLEKLGVKK